MKEFAVTPELEKNGTSLINDWINCLPASTERIVEQHQMYINHTDSRGNTPLATLLKDRGESFSALDTLLKYGAVPNKHRGDQLSPMALALIHGYYPEKVTLINMLVEYGADVNAPCLYNNRMCSPLMIAVLCKAHTEITMFLVALGARTNYQDETGRSVIDCACEISTNLAYELSLY
jgi:ankyrin repeat protein